MKVQKALSAALFLFVLAAVATVAFKEVRRREATRTANIAPTANTPAAAPAPDGAARGAIPPTDSRPSRPSSPEAGPPAKVAAEPAPAPARTIVVTYFITTTRCFSCYKIETLTESAVVNTFAGPLRDGRLQWRVVNTDEPKNAHYLKDYKLFTKSVIVSEVVGGREVRWKNCEKVWTLLDDPKAFETYIVSEVKAYLGEA